jgi:hypothetical protein
MSLQELPVGASLLSEQHQSKTFVADDNQFFSSSCDHQQFLHWSNNGSRSSKMLKKSRFLHLSYFPKFQQPRSILYTQSVNSSNNANKASQISQGSTLQTRKKAQDGFPRSKHRLNNCPRRLNITM